MPTINKINNNIKIFALGGLGEVGKNMYIIERNDEIIVIDSGMIFPDFDLGIDYIIPNFAYLKENEDRIIGLFITHAHEDHIGALPYLLASVKIPNVYASGIAVNMIKSKINEFKNIPINLVEFTNDSVFTFKNFSIEFFRTNHSIPDSYGIAIKTDLGYILHTGDFKFDLTPIGNKTEYNKITNYGEKGVLALLSDSTNANVSSSSPSEKKISESLKSLFEGIKGRIIISTFASNVYRLEQIINASVQCGRKVIVFGRSLEKAISIGQQMKYIKHQKDSFLTVDELMTLPPNKITIISTGSQGEPLAALTRIAEGTHKTIKLIEGDTIVFSSSAIPGNKEHINRTINKLYKAGASVIVSNPLADTHSSGHASQYELQLMLNFTRPKYFVPIHGEYPMQKKHCDLAIECGVNKNNCFILKNGEILQINEGKAEKKGKVNSGILSIDKYNSIIPENILKERKALSEDGIVTLTFIIQKNKLVQKPSLNSRGFIYMKNSNELISNIENKAYKAANSYLFKIKNGHFYESKFKKDMELEMSNYINELTSSKPAIVIIAIQI